MFVSNRSLELDVELEIDALGRKSWDVFSRALKEGCEVPVTVECAPRETEMIMNWCARFMLLIGVLGGGFAHANDESEAFVIEPMEVRLALPSENADRPSTRLKVINKEDHDVSMRIDCFHRDEDVDGAERRSLTKDVKVDVSDFTLPARVHAKFRASASFEMSLNSEKTMKVRTAFAHSI